MKHCLTASKLYPPSATEAVSYLCSGEACLIIIYRNQFSPKMSFLPRFVGRYCEDLAQVCSGASASLVGFKWLLWSVRQLSSPACCPKHQAAEGRVNANSTPSTMLPVF